MSENHGSNVWRFLDVLAARRGLIVGLTLLGMIGSVVVALMLPKWYLAESLLLPPKDSGLSMVGTVDLAQAASVTGGIQLPAMVTPSDVYVRMLTSRTILDSVIEHLQLKQHYRTSNQVDTRKALESLSRFRVTEEGLLSIAVEDRDPEMASRIANMLVEELERLNSRIVFSRAHSTREFIDGRLEAVEAQLDSARAEFESFQMEHRAFDFGEQTRLAIAQATDLKIEAARVEIEISLSEKVLGNENPKLVELRRRQQSVDDQLSKLEYGGNDSSYFSLPLSRMPGLKGEFEVLRGRVKVSESIYISLLGLREQARIQEQTQVEKISVLDKASPPEIRSRPQRTLVVAGTTFVSFVLALLLAMFLEYFKRLETEAPEDYQRAARFINAYLGWLPGVRVKAKPPADRG